jgi:hypothetical protein
MRDARTSLPAHTPMRLERVGSRKEVLIVAEDKEFGLFATPLFCPTRQYVSNVMSAMRLLKVLLLLVILMTHWAGALLAAKESRRQGLAF